MIARPKPASWFVRLGLFMVIVAALLIATGGAAQSSPGGSSNVAAAFTVSPTTAVPNQQVSLFGTGFTSATTGGGNGPAGAHQITGIGTSGITISGTLLTAPHVAYPIDLDSNGNWAVSVMIPVNATSLLGGVQEIRVVDDAGLLAIASYTLPARTLAVSPTNSGRNSAVTVTGTGYPASNGFNTGGNTVSLEYDSISVGNFSPDANGDLHAVITVPMTAGSPSTNSVKATILGTGRSNSVIHEIPGPTVTVTPDSGPPGTVATIAGADFPGFVPVSAINADAVPVMTLPGPSTNSFGEFSSTVIIPNFPEGPRSILTTAGGVSVITVFVVTDSSVPPVTATTLEPSSGADLALAPLTSADNLLRVWNFNNATKEWFFYDPRPAFAAANTLTEMVPGQPYWIMVLGNQSTILNGASRSLYAGWNLIPW